MKVFGRSVMFFLVFLFLAGFAAAGDRETILALLKKHSPDGNYIMESFIKANDGSDFMEYWRGTSEDSRWSSYNTIVHESAHGVMSCLADRNSLFFPVSYKTNVMVPLTETYFSREMVDIFPKELRTFRFATYVDCKEDNLGSQCLGAYGLLDEMTAYYLGTKAVWDLLPHFEALGAEAPWSSFFQTINGSLYGVMEFKLYVLKYLMFAEKNHPDQYRKIMANAEFARAFILVDAAASAFFRDYFAGKERVYESLQKKGLTAKERGDFLEIGKPGKTICNGLFKDVFNLLTAELEKKDYQNLMQKINGGKAVAATPRFGEKGTAPKPTAPETPPAVAVDTPKQETPEKSEPERKPERPAAEDAKTTAQGRSAATVIAEIHAASKNKTAKAILTRNAVDKQGDGAKDFLDITRSDLALFPDQLIVGITCASFPGKLLFNSPNLEDDMLEYEWSCAIDLDGDGKDDYLLSLSSFKVAKSKPIEATITLYCQTSLWKLTEKGGSLVEASTAAETAGSAVFITLDDGPDFPLKQMTAKTKFTVKTFYDDGKGGSEDSLGL